MESLIEVVAVYTILGLGFTLFFGVAKTANFAWCDTVVLACVLLSVSSTWCSAAYLSFAVSILVTTFFIVVLNVSIFVVCFRPFPNALSLWPALASLATGLVIREGIALVFPFGTQQIGTPRFLRGILGHWFSPSLLLLAIFAVLCCDFAYKRSRFGLQVRAVSDDPEAAEVLGISSVRTFLAFFAMTGLVTVFAAFLLEAKLGFIKYNLGPVFTVQGFVAACLGGLRRPGHVLFGGLVMASMEWVLGRYVRGGATFLYVGLFICLAFWYATTRLLPSFLRSKWARL